MPKRTDISSILLIGAGPIIIGQACEFDYSGTQAAKALRREGYRVILINSNPATIMTDPEIADATYIEPLTIESAERIIAKERPDAIISTMGGQTGLNLAKSLHEAGILEKYGVKLIGAGFEAIRRGEDREAFRQVCADAGVGVPRAEVGRTIEDGLRIAVELGYPIVLRPAFTLGGTGSGIAKNENELRQMLGMGLLASPVGEVLIEECLTGWKEFELEVMRDAADRCVVICVIENIDAMGVHTGDSATVAPAMTLSDRLYQPMRDAAFAILRGVGVETGGSNVQFALHPETGRMLAIEMNPRVSRSSALASKATGFPIAKIAALLAAGYLLDEVTNDITGRTKAAFEPALDYVVTKIPRFAFEKFQEADQTLTTSMKSVGEVMAIGRNFPESLQKALRGLEIGRSGLAADGKGLDGTARALRLLEPHDARRREFLREILYKVETPNCDRLFNIKYALMMGVEPAEVARLSHIDLWFISQIQRLVDFEAVLEANAPDAELLAEAKRLGYSDVQIAFLTKKTEDEVRALRKSLGVKRVYKCVDTCAGEFEAVTPYYYGTFGDETEVKVSEREKVIILGSGPNRIGQGIEFDCCCCHAVQALRDDGYETIMINSNPETVSTDYDTSDKLFFEPVVVEDVLDVWEATGAKGVIVTIGGQTPLSIAHGIERRGVKILGTSVESIDRAEDRERFAEVIRKLGLRQPANTTVLDIDGAVQAAAKIGYPILVRPSYVLGGRAMAVARTEAELRELAADALHASDGRPLLIDEYLDNVIEVDADALRDGRRTVIAGVMEHVEPAGVHSGDSAGSFPAYTLPAPLVEAMKDATRKLADELEVCGLINVQFAIKNGEIYVLEVNPRASRTVPFLEKATGIAWAGAAARVMLGKTIDELGIADGSPRGLYYVKEVVLPFNRFQNVDPVLSPEMKSTGEVMGIGATFAEAYLKAQLAAGNKLPKSGGVLFSVADRDKPGALAVARGLCDLGFTLMATAGTARFLHANGVAARAVPKILEGSSEIIDEIRTGGIGLVINTRNDRRGAGDARRIDRAAMNHNVPVYSTLRAAQALAEALAIHVRVDLAAPKSLQEIGRA
jgi:carbamoyl-phosphate synthase large subunit